MQLLWTVVTYLSKKMLSMEFIDHDVLDSPYGVYIH